MKFALTGGDGRFVRLCRLLRADGHEVRPFALEKELPDSTESAAEALDGADCLILPLPCLRGGRLNAPFSAMEHDARDILRHAAPGTVVCAGMAGELRSRCEALGLPLHDYFEREDFALANSLLTAEGCIELLLTESERSLHGSRVLICGFGRIGRMLAPRLLALGARVTVAARSGEALAW
ncbi:MAG: dipicolinate synthase, partial [Butyricicoccus sp.]|nr:dipicolinate synthase [Butyricicoccus sp.]